MIFKFEFNSFGTQPPGRLHASSVTLWSEDLIFMTLVAQDSIIGVNISRFGDNLSRFGD